MSALSNLGAKAKGLTDSVMAQGQRLFDNFFPPEKRAAFISKLQAWASTNPKLAAFLATNVVLTGIPLLMFLVFTLTVFVFSLLAALLVGVLVALAVTLFAVGVALFVILPTVFLTTMGASFLFLWGLGGYYIVKWFNEGDSPAKPGEAIGEKLSSLTGGRLDFLTNSAQNPSSQTTGKGTEKSSEKSAANGAPKKSDGHENGRPVGAGTGNTAGQAKGHADTATNTAGQAKGHTETASKVAGPDNVTKKAGNATNTTGTAAGAAKGSVS